MRLTFEQIREITVGAVEIFQQDDGVHFRRCTQKQIDAWATRAAGLGERAAATTGVRLDFHTNSREMYFSVSPGKYDVLVDGLLRASFESNGEQTFSVLLNDLMDRKTESVRVTLCLPNHDKGGVVKEIILDDGASVTKHEFDRKFLFFGDSITQGWDSGQGSMSYAYQTSLFFNAESVVQGVGGAYFHESTFDELGFDPDVVFVAYGTNDYDYYGSMDEARTHCAAFLGKVADRYGNKKLVCITPIWRGDHAARPRKTGTFAEMIDMIAEEAAARSFTVVDGLTLVPPIREYYIDDFLHPNAHGFTQYTKNLAAKLVKVIK